MKKLYKTAMFGLFFSIFVVTPAMGTVIPAGDLEVPTTLIVGGTSTPVNGNWLALTVDVKWNWVVKSQGHSGGKYQDFAVIAFPPRIIFSNPRRPRRSGDRIGTLKTNLFDDTGSACITEIEWTMMKPNGDLVVGQHPAAELPGMPPTPDSPYPGSAGC